MGRNGELRNMLPHVISETTAPVETKTLDNLVRLGDEFTFVKPRGEKRYFFQQVINGALQNPLPGPKFTDGEGTEVYFEEGHLKGKVATLKIDRRYHLTCFRWKEGKKIVSWFPLQKEGPSNIGVVRESARFRVTKFFFKSNPK